MKDKQITILYSLNKTRNDTNLRPSVITNINAYNSQIQLFSSDELNHSNFESDLLDSIKEKINKEEEEEEEDTLTEKKNHLEFLKNLLNTYYGNAGKNINDPTIKLIESHIKTIDEKITQIKKQQ